MSDVDNYASLLTGYHIDKPKFLETVQKTLQPLVDAQNLLSELYRYFDLDPHYGETGFEAGFSDAFGADVLDTGAVGPQLDVDGKWINLSRDVRLPLRGPWFTWDDSTRGWETGVWREPFDTGTYLTQLDDETYRRLLKARIRANRWDGTAAQAEEILRNYFTDTTYRIMVEDHQTMSVFHTIAGRIPSLLDLELFSGDYLPLHKAGVRTYHLVTTVNESALFGFDMNTAYIAGWDNGAWGAPPSYLIEHNLAS